MVSADCGCSAGSPNEHAERINQAEQAEAESMFLACCGSHEMDKVDDASSRPFLSEDELMDTAAGIWNDLETSDWLEAFSAHPKIGETKPAPIATGTIGRMVGGRASGNGSADEWVRQGLAAANRAYYEKFGFIFIVCATGKTAEGDVGTLPGPT